MSTEYGVDTSLEQPLQQQVFRTLTAHFHVDPIRPHEGRTTLRKYTRISHEQNALVPYGRLG